MEPGYNRDWDRVGDTGERYGSSYEDHVTVLALSRHMAAGLSITDKLNEEIGSLVATVGKN